MPFFYLGFIPTLYCLLKLPFVDGSFQEILFMLSSLILCIVLIKDESRFLQNKVIVQLLFIIMEIIFYSTIYYLDSDFSILELLAYGFLILPVVLVFPKTIQQ